MLKKFYLYACGLAALAGLPAVASAQRVSPPPNNTQYYLTQEPPKPDNGENQFVGPLAPVGQFLANEGVHLNVTFSDTFADAGTQGLTHWGTANLGKLRLEGDFNLSRFGLEGGSLVVAETIHVLRRNPYEYLTQVGDSPGNSVIGNHKPNNYLSILAYRQKLFNDRVEFEIGRFNPSYDFDPDICEQGPVCALDIAKFTGVFLPVDYGQLGATLRFNLPQDFFVEFGEFEVLPPPGFKSGLNFLLADSTGALSLAQIGHTTTAGTSYYPGTYGITFFQNSSKQTDPLNAKIGRYGTSAVMGYAQQTVWRSDFGPIGSLPAHHLDLYGKAAVTPDPYQDYSTEVDAGVNYFGILPGRPSDILGFKLSYFRPGADALEAQELARVKLGGLPEQTPPNEFRFEVMATIDLYRNTTLTPDILYIKNADDFSGKSRYIPSDGFEYTLSLHVPLGSLFGLAPEKVE